MLRLKKLTIFQYKNYLQHQLNFNEKVIGICGSNGIGKTNLLDAIYYLCFTKSYFSKTDSNTVHRTLQGMRLEGNFVLNESEEQIVCILRENNKKEVRRNGESYKRFSEHIGRFPAVIIAPDDVDLITGNSEVRRRFIDTLLCQVDHQYLQSLIDYNKVLQHRNSLLKSSAERGYRDEALLEVLTNQLLIPGNYIFNKRIHFLKKFLPEVAEKYLQIAGTQEPVILKYYSHLLSDTFENLLNIYKQKDILLQRTTIGIHKDDLQLQLAEVDFKSTASQGQRKSLLFALKLQELEELKSAKGFAPILLLDDVFEKLDADRMQNLLKQVCTESDSQVFITDTHKERLQQAFQSLSISFQMIEL